MGKANQGGSGGMIPRKFFINLGCQKCDFRYLGGQNNPKKELFMITWEVARFTCLNPVFFLKLLSL